MADKGEKDSSSGGAAGVAEFPSDGTKQEGVGAGVVTKQGGMIEQDGQPGNQPPVSRLTADDPYIAF
jgi:hypothetical protein